MRYSLLFVIATLLVAPVSSLIMNERAIAHQHRTVGNVRVTVHLNPDDSPFAGVPSLTWFHLTTANGDTIPLADCNCNLAVYDSQNRVIPHPPLAETEVEGHERPIATTLVFPGSGQYRVVLTATSKTGSFNAFELVVPVTVRAQLSR